MAYKYDEMGNIIGEYESDEERRAREAKELADTAVHTQETKTYGDGTVERVTKEAIPAVAIKPIAPIGLDQSAYTAQQESGNKPDIGYHFPADEQGRRKSTAYGMFGITAPAYQDVQKANPKFAGRDITTLNPDEQKEAYTTLTGLNTQRLQGLGVEPTEGAQRLAHLLGAGGAAKFLKTGEVSEAAARANGGMENLKRIAGQRMTGQEAASSGAVNLPNVPQARPEEGVAVVGPNGVQGTQTIMGPVSPGAVNQQAQNEMQNLQQYAVSPEQTAQTPQPEPVSPYSLSTGYGNQGITAPGIAAGQPAVTPSSQAHEVFQKNQDNMQALIGMRNDQSLPEYIRKRSADRAYELMNNEYQKQAALEKAGNLTPLEAGKILTTTPKDKEGSWLKYALLSWINPHHAENEASKLGISPTTWTQSTIKDVNGNDIPVEVRTDKTGKTFEGNILGTDQRLTVEQLQQAAGSKALGKGTSLSAPVYIDKEGNRYRSGYDASGASALVNIQGGKPFKGTPKDLTLESIGTTQIKADIGLIADLKKKHGNNVLDAEKDYVSLNGPMNQEQRAEFRQAYGFNLAQPGAQGAQNVQGGTTAVQGQIGQAGVSGTTPSNINVPIAQQKENLAISKDQAIERNKSNEAYNEKLAKNRETALPQKATIDRLQTAIDKNPNFWGIDTNSPAWRAFVDVNSTNENKADSLNTLARNLNIPSNKRSEFDQTMNDYRALQVNAITGSGLSASQTNTEKESQRVVGTVGSISDKPAAAKATLEYAKAKIEYADAKAKAWAEARKANPNLDRNEFDINFDVNQGAKIFEDANKRMADIIGGKATIPTPGSVKGGYRFKGGNPADKNNWEKI